MSLNTAPSVGLRRRLSQVLRPAAESQVGSSNLGLFRSVTGSFALKVTAAGLNLLTVMVMTRTLGAAGYGAFVFAVSITAIFTTISLCGLESIVVRGTAVYQTIGDWGKLRGLGRFSVGLALISSVLLGVGLYLTPVFAPNALSPDFLATAAATAWVVPGLALVRMQAARLQGLHRTALAQTPELLLRPLLLLAGVWMCAQWSSHFDVHSAVYALAFATWAAALFAWVCTRKTEPIECRAVDCAFEVRPWMSGAGVLLALAAVRVCGEQIDRLLLGSLVGAEAAGLYIVGKAAASTAAFGLLAVNASLGSRAARLFAEKDHDGLQSLTTRAVQGMAALSAPVLLVVALAGRPLLGFLFGPEFESAYPVLLILIAGEWVRVATGSPCVLLTMTGHERKVTVVSFASLAVQTVLHLILIPRYGAVGAAVASAVSAAGHNVVLASIARRTLGIRTTLWFGRSIKSNVA